MAIQTVTTIDVEISGVKVDEFGISDTLDTYSDSEIADFLYVGGNSRILGGNIDFYAANAGSYDTWNAGMPFNTGSVTSSIMTMKSGDGTYDCPAEGRYLGIILLHSLNDIYNDYITVSNSNGYVALTEFNAKKYLLEINANLTQVASVGATSFTDKTNTLYNPNFTSISVRYNNGGAYYNINYSLVPYHVLEYGGYLYLIHAFNENKTAEFRCSFNSSPIWNAGTVYYPVSYNDISKSISISFNGYGFGSGWNNISPDDFVWSYNGSSLEKYNDSDYVWIRTAFSQRQFRCYYYFKTYTDCMMMFANSGMYFRINGDTVYKPLISNNVVYGFTDNLDAESDIDNYTGSTKHDIPVTPPTPPAPEEDESDDQAWGGAYSGAGAFSKFYLCTATDLANLRTWFGGGGSGDPIPDGFDPMGQVLGLLQYPVSISGTALAPEEIIFRSGKTIIHTGVNADRSTGGFLHLDCGSVEIPRRMQQRGVPFLDFETTLEIYVPFCGTAPLDVQTCVGKTLTCDMYVATATGDVSAVIAAGGHPVAYMSGNMAESLPISSSGYGMYLAACKSTWGNGVSQVMNQLTGGTTSTIKNVNQAALNETLSYGQTGGWGQSELLAESYNNPAIGRGMAGAASAKGVAAIGLTTTALNIANAASTGYEQYQRVKHASYTSVSGSFTSCAAWNYPFTPYVKITRPLKQIPTGGRGDYKHTAAIPLVETRTLSGAPGLTTCVNPDVSGISNATAQEKDIIYRALVNGVIV